MNPNPPPDFRCAFIFLFQKVLSSMSQVILFQKEQFCYISLQS
jgi:hypothetical protein